MKSYVDEIQQLERETNTLYQAVKIAFELRMQSPAKWQDWEIAAEKFQSHRSELDPLIESCYHSTPYPITADQRRFLFDYLLVDPQFFRSGYLMERFVRKVKRMALSGEEQHIIRRLLMSRIRIRGLRNIRDICRMIPIIEDAELRAEVEMLTESHDAAIRRRAKFALAYFSR